MLKNPEKRRLLSKAIFFVLSLLILLIITNNSLHSQTRSNRNSLLRYPSPASEINLKEIPYKIVYETYRRTEGEQNWELYIINADGSNPVNLTNTPDLDELYPHASPDGSKICFVVDEGTNRRNKVRNVYYMNIDGSERVLVARNARQPCWSPDGKKIAYLRGEYERYNKSEYASAGLVIYDLETKQHSPHPNTNLIHLYAICWSPDGNWFLGVVKGNSTYSDAILAFEANGMGVYDLAQFSVKGCRPDFAFNGNMITWGETDWDLNIGQISLEPPWPQVKDVRTIVGCRRTSKVYHVDFSPDSKYIAFSYGPSRGSQQVGSEANGWDICVTDMSGKWVKITTDGNHNKEPDWIPIPPSPEEETPQEETQEEETDTNNT